VCRHTDLPPEWHALIRELADYFREPVVVALAFRVEFAQMMDSEESLPDIATLNPNREFLREAYEKYGPLAWPLDLERAERRYAAAQANAAAEDHPPTPAASGSFASVTPARGSVWDREVGDDADASYFEQRCRY
jgi:hypothetical protein